MSRWLSDRAVAHLRGLGDVPDVSGTRYSIVSRLGAGGMGVVYLAEDRDLGRRVALKVLHPESCDAETAERLRREARILARLEHPGIVPVHEIGELADGRTFYVMKFVQGQRLDEVLLGPVPLAERLVHFLRICDAVAFAHAHGIVHRDLKPENVMIGPFGEVLVLDWGVAKRVGDAPDVPRTPLATGTIEPEGTLTEDGVVLGTPAYMAPEQRRGEPVDARADVHALGSLLHVLVAGTPVPAPGIASPAARSRSRALAAVAARATAVDPAARYATADALADEIRRFQAGARVHAHAERPFERAARLAVRFRTPLVLVAAYLAVRAALLIWFGR